MDSLSTFVSFVTDSREGASFSAAIARCAGQILPLQRLGVACFPQKSCGCPLYVDTLLPTRPEEW